VQAVESSESQLSALLNTKLMVVATKHKWDEYVMQRVVRRLCWSLVHFALAGTAMVVSTQLRPDDDGGSEADSQRDSASALLLSPRSIADLLQGGLICTNSLVLRHELWQLRLTSSITEYLADPWNLLDLGGILTLYVAATAHFLHAPFVVQQVGSAGLLLNSFSILQMFRPFDLTGPLIATVLEILYDIRGYVCILGVLLYGFSMCFAVSMPENEAFFSHSGHTGPLVGLMTTFQAAVGTFAMSDYTNSGATAVFYLFLFLMVVVMLNLLIAIMGNSYDNIKESEVVEARKLRARTIIDEEALMLDSGECENNPAYFPAYLEVLQVTEPPEEDRGVSGQISQLTAEVDDVKANISNVEAKVDGMAAEMGAMKQLVEQLLELQQQ
jgi:hypothetical protein